MVDEKVLEGMMKLDEFDYKLPEERIAQYPAEKRDESRLLVVNRKNGNLQHTIFKKIIHFMDEGDALVINDTKVIPARLLGKKGTGGKVEILLLKKCPTSQGGCPHEGVLWECFINSSKRTKEGTKIYFDESLEGEVTKAISQGRWVVRFRSDDTLEEALEKVGSTPLPPYIKRNGEPKYWQGDRERYQTVFARKKGAIAAPTAGLHFTQELISRIQDKGVNIARITVHIGLGTFMPVRVEDIEDHVLMPEFFEIDHKAANVMNDAITHGKKVIAVGTSTTRALESAVCKDKRVEPMSGYATLFIYPGYTFKIVDALITNFHLPKFTPLLMVYAFGGKALIENTYEKAIKERYRFLSYGDGMMIL